MTTRAEIIDQAKAIGETFNANVEAPLFLHVTMPFTDDLTFYFSSTENPNSWDNYCSVSVTFDYQTREQTDDVGFFSEQNIKINFRSSSISALTYSKVQPKVAACNKAVELMGLLVAALPQSVTERLATHAERVEENKILAATNYCRPIVGNNSKNMRVEGAKVLPAAPEAIRRGEYTITHNGKKFNVALTDQHTLLVRVS